MPDGLMKETIGVEETTCEGRVYREIKARVIACDFEQGKPIRLGALARQLGVSTTPVREALNMLTAKGLVINELHKGFVAMSLAEDWLIGLYRLNRVLLNSALFVHSSIAEAEVPAAAVSAIAGIGNDIDQGEQHDPETIAKYTGELFARIAALAGNSHILKSVNSVNDRLYYVRTLECQQSPTVAEELMRICEQFLAEQFGELEQSIADYHDHRMALLPDLMHRIER